MSGNKTPIARGPDDSSVCAKGRACPNKAECDGDHNCQHGADCNITACKLCHPPEPRYLQGRPITHDQWIDAVDEEGKKSTNFLVLEGSGLLAKRMENYKRLPTGNDALPDALCTLARRCVRDMTGKGNTDLTFNVTVPTAGNPPAPAVVSSKRSAPASATATGNKRIRIITPPAPR